MKPIISIVVCVYNGEPYLPGCLESLISQTAAKDTFEVLIINNNSTDRTEEIAQKFVAAQPNFKVFNEPTVGLSAARNRGLQEASGAYVAYLDDDAKAAPNFVEVALQIIKDKQPEIFGGPIYPCYEGEHLPWVKDAYNSYSVYETGYLVKDQYLSGSNIFISTQLLHEHGGFNTALGMKGEYAGYHEETAFQLQLREEGKQIYYDKKLVVTHLVPRLKQNVLYYIYSNYKSGKDGKYLWDAKYGYDEMLGLFKDIDSFFMGIETAVKLRDTQTYEYAENYVVEKLVPQLFSIGSRVEYFSQHQVISLEEYLKYFVQNKEITLLEYLRMYQALSNRQLSFKEIVSAYTALMQRDMQPAELIQAYRYNVSAGLIESLKNAVWMIVLARPIRKLVRKVRSLLSKNS